VDLGWNVLALDPADLPALVARPGPPATDQTPYGDGHAAQAVVAALVSNRR
jgi:UDP-N-acetylglucosamine 2-epimerase (non-hydrolysing)